MSAKLGEILVRENLISPQHLRQALDYQREHGGRLGYTLVKLGLVSDDTITAVLSRQYGIPSVNLELFNIDDSVLRLIPQEVAQKYSVLPLSRVGATLTLAMVDPTNVFAMDDIKFMTGLNVEPVVVAEASVQTAIAKYYSTSREIELAAVAPDLSVEGLNGNGFSQADLVSLDSLDFDQESLASEVDVLEDNDEIDLSSLTRMSEDAPVVRLVNVLLVDALRRGASDIHVEPYEKELRIRFRIDGVLYDVMHPPLKMRDALISRIKIMSKLDISEKRLPQDGRIKVRVKVDSRSRELDFRVSTLPTLFGEKVVLRLLDKEKLMLDMTNLGFEPESLVKFQRNISKPYGMVLVTGPTGSGKTNTLYSALQSLNTVDTNIMTAEDPTPPEALVEIGFSLEDAKTLKTYKGRGCPSCNETGYKGRIGLYEVMEVTDEIRELILIGASALELRKKSIEDGMITLRESGLQKIRNGVTTVEEVVRETVA